MPASARVFDSVKPQLLLLPLRVVGTSVETLGVLVCSYSVESTKTCCSGIFEKKQILDFGNVYSNHPQHPKPLRKKKEER